MRLAVCGGRNYDHYNFLSQALDYRHAKTPITCIIQGGAEGADKLARIWARRNGVTLETYEAQWRKHGRSAGPIRNQRIVDEGKPDELVAFPGGNGTEDMIEKAVKAHIPVTRYGDTKKSS